MHTFFHGKLLHSLTAQLLEAFKPKSHVFGGYFSTKGQSSNQVIVDLPCDE